MKAAGPSNFAGGVTQGRKGKRKMTETLISEVGLGNWKVNAILSQKGKVKKIGIGCNTVTRKTFDSIAVLDGTFDRGQVVAKSGNDTFNQRQKYYIGKRGWDRYRKAITERHWNVDLKWAEIRKIKKAIAKLEAGGKR
jgi:hypothetical protein